MKIRVSNYQFFDDLVIGGGGAGLTAAINLALCGRKVAILSKASPWHSPTNAAQGGINANFGNQTQDDWRWHLYDTIKASAYIADKDAAEILCKNANDAVNFLHEIGVKFDLDENGKILQKIYGGQTINYGSNILAKRACSVKDRTGSAIVDALMRYAANIGIVFLNYHYVCELIYHDYECYGVKSYDIATGRFWAFYSQNTIIATGGYGQVFQSCTSPSQCTGDGARLISDLGLSLKNMEFVQFHPTSMKDTGILISETARSIGGYLLNPNGIRFMEKYSAEYKELATRDIVARAIFTESKSLQENIYLDMRHVCKDIIRQKLGYVYDMCKVFLHQDMSRDLIEIQPSTHYCMGGVPANANAQVLDYLGGREYIVDGLYTVGEAACNSVHGAGRLGCNSLLEIIVFGGECAKYILANSSKTTHKFRNKNKYIDIEAYMIIDLNNLHNIKSELKRICQTKVGIIRDHTYLTEAITEIDYLSGKFKDLKSESSASRWDLEFIATKELESMLICARHMAVSALLRKESRGAHYRSDFASADDNNYRKHSFSRVNNKTIEVNYINCKN
ncbi:MAG: FAD-binding protein [Rickettsiaceae bacterium]|nr:FAD-binding protein [Rickettsiaceae bacterium]